MGQFTGTQGSLNPLVTELLRPPPATGLGQKGGGGFFGGVAQGAQAAMPQPGASLLEALNQQFNRPSAEFQGPLLPAAGVPFATRLKATFRGLF